MFDQLQKAFWKALTPDLVADTPTAAAEPSDGLSADIVAALGGVDNLKSQQPLALTRVRVVLRDVSHIDQRALSAAGPVDSTICASPAMSVCMVRGLPSTNTIISKGSAAPPATTGCAMPYASITDPTPVPPGSVSTSIRETAG